MSPRTEASDKVQIGLTPLGAQHLDAVMRTQWFENAQDAYRLAIAERIVSVVSSAACSISTEGFVGSQRDLPWACVVEFPSGISRRYSMYFWTVSHGGRARPVTEYRIQVKLKDRRSLDFGKGTTLLLGYYTRTSDRVGRDLGNHP